MARLFCPKSKAKPSGGVLRWRGALVVDVALTRKLAKQLRDH